MTILLGQFSRVAESVAEQIADLLAAPVSVLDGRGMVIARGGDFSGAREAPPVEGAEPECLRVPIRLHGQVGEVVVEMPGAGEAVSPRLAQAIVELTIAQALAVAGLSSQDELKNKFIHDLLHGQGGDETDIRREGQILGMDFTRPRAVILVEAADYILVPGGPGWTEESEARIRRRARRVIDGIVRFFQLPNDAICAYIGDGEVVVLKASATRDLVAWADRPAPAPESDSSWADLGALKRASGDLLARLQAETSTAITIGIGRYHPEIRGLARSYQDARAALSLGRRFHGRNQVHCLDALGIAAFVGVTDERTKIGLARHLLSPLDQESELLETLDVFFYENCSPSATAQRLSIHRNTLTYRLEKIASLTGLDPRRFDDAVQIRLALVVRSLRGTPS